MWHLYFFSAFGLCSSHFTDSLWVKGCESSLFTVRDAFRWTKSMSWCFFSSYQQHWKSCDWLARLIASWSRLCLAFCICGRLQSWSLHFFYTFCRALSSAAALYSEDFFHIAQTFADSPLPLCESLAYGRDVQRPTFCGKLQSVSTDKHPSWATCI